MKKALDGRDWYLKDYFGRDWEWRNDHKNQRTTGWMTAQVPGVVQEDLLEHGEIENPYYEMNSLKCEWASHRNWVYKKFFRAEEAWKGKKIRLHYEGIDYAAEFYLNGKYLGSHEGMFMPVEFDVTEHILFDEENIVSVVIDEAPREQPQVGYSSRVTTTKARVNYWWDFATRLVPLGIWDEVYLLVTEHTHIADVKTSTDIADDYLKADTGHKIAVCSPEEQNVTVKVRLSDEHAVIQESVQEYRLRPGHNLVEVGFTVNQPQLWWPNGYGSQPLYTLEVMLLKGNEVLDRNTSNFGIRKIERETNDGFDDAPSYVIKVNGERIFIKGWNWVPIDLMYGRKKEERYKQLLTLARDAHVNLLRVWGGGLIEKKIFYDICDRYGILVWQEFNQSSSGIENKPNEDPVYIARLEEYAKEVVLKRSQHASLAIWCGGNELQSDDNIPLDENNIVLKTLGEVVKMYGNGQLYFPTSAYGEVFGLTMESAKNKKGKLYDIHSPWEYQGPTKQYELFNENTCAFHSEFGVQGTPSVHTLNKILSEKNIWPPSKQNKVWMHHGPWWFNYDQMVEIFGGFQDIWEYSCLSQYIQAEALRYSVESNRRRKYQCGGVIPWQFNEPWPNAHCTNSVDYYLRPKMAYYYIKKAYEPLHVSLKYPAQLFEKEVSCEVWVNSSLRQKEMRRITVAVYNAKGQQIRDYEYHVEIYPNASLKVADISFEPEQQEKVVYIRASIGGIQGYNEYLRIRGKDLSPLREMESTKLEMELLDGKVTIQNTGTNIAFFVNLDTENEAARFENNFVTLLPGESTAIRYEKVKEPCIIEVSGLNVERKGLQSNS